MEEYSEKPPPPTRKRFYKNKKFWIICALITAIVVVVVVCLMVFVFFPMIAQSLMNQSGIAVNAASITFSPPASAVTQTEQHQNTDPTKQFYMSMDSSMKNTGPFTATLKFHNPIRVYYKDSLLGNITLPDSTISGGQGNLVAQTPFLIEDANYFGQFSKDMLSAESFDWNMQGLVDITALGRTATVNLNKQVTIAGMNGFKQVRIQSFQLPSDAPQGGINVELGTVLTSPSPVGVEMGTITMDMYYEGVGLGRISADNVTLQKGDNNINLKGVLVPQTDPNALVKVGQMFTQYVGGQIAATSAIGVSTVLSNNVTVPWLNAAFQTVQLNVGLQNQGGPLQMIHAVSMGYLDLAFNGNSPYSPSLSAPAVVADYSMPFGFSLAITQVTQNLTMYTNSTGNFSQLAVPWVPSQSNQQTGKLQFGIANANLVAMAGKNDAFDQYTYDLTASNLYSFGVLGQACTQTSTPIGNITMCGVTFDVQTSLHGLQFLNSTPTAITSVDMTGGTQNALQLAIGVSMGNPSDFSMSVQDVTFNMLTNDSTQVGTATLSNLTLQRGQNNVIAHANFDPRSTQQGQNMLSTFVMGQNSSTSIGGYAGSTAIASLAKALGAVHITTVLPGLPKPLIQSASLFVPGNAIQTSTVEVSVVIANPFTAGLAISKVQSSATYKGMPVGNINQDISNNPFVIGGHANGTSPQLNMQMNMEPGAVALLMRDLAVDAHLDTNALDALLGMGGFHIQGQQDIAPQASVFAGFNISDFVIKAMTALKTDLDLTSTLHVGDYVDDLAFSQKAVQINADPSVVGLIPIVGQPIVQAIVNGANLGFNTLVLSNPTENNANVQMVGSITNTGPMDATIAFPSPLTIRWQGKQIGTATMPAVQALADKGAQFNVPSNFIITDGNAMQEFTSYMINNEEFIWEIVSTDVAVTALGFTFNNISMDKFVTIKGCNGFKNAVTINSFNLPANDPAGGITLTTATNINNPSQVGFSLTSVQFDSYYQDVYVGPLGANPANFAPAASSAINMTGRMVPQTGDGLQKVQQLFENYLNAKDTPLTVKGAAASGPMGQVGWLTNAFKTLSIDNVILPGPKEKPQLIGGINMANMQLDFTKDAWAPPTGSTLVQAQLHSPFGFPLGVSQLSMEVDSEIQGQKMAHLSIPTEKATTDNNNVVTTAFSGVPFAVSNHDLFSGFLAALTKNANGTFELAGTSSALAQTAIGPIQLAGVTFDVQTSMAGFNNFNGKTTIVSTSVSGGTPEYTIVDTVIAYDNPSAITINVGNINFSSKMNDDGSVVGSVFMENVVIKPGPNQFNGVFHMQGTTEAIGRLYSAYMTNALVPMTVFGTSTSTNIPSLQPAFETVSLTTTMQGIQSNMVNSVKLSVTVEQLVNKQATIIVTLNNPLKTQMALVEAKAEMYWPGPSGEVLVGHVDSIVPCTVPAGGTTTCQPWSAVVDASIIQLLPIVAASNKNMNLRQNVTGLIGTDGGGYQAKFYYYQNNVPTEMDANLGPLGSLPLGSTLNSTSNPTQGLSNSPSASATATSPVPTKPTDTPSPVTPLIPIETSSQPPKETEKPAPTASSGAKPIGF
ncbi:hypothetical protein DM01DRAFT_1365756 [Hesseltinella vesiculosa]|uniref:Tag1-like fourth Ig-like domain-containing protein n=1 Tax=Hesseltinella vesiculosa TaxID=101127 RepID=A0A1X2GUX4_9FUNG|nr:hypothetical protein DM01DRAFT_1365756 [Hesseltinella vesiculosa]